MKKLFKYSFLTCIILCFSCSTKFEKPFIIISKELAIVQTGKNKMFYKYQDKNGKINYFFDDINKYNVGDTLK